ncbi:DUF4199 domain-containing protein [Mucilaginibacter conchicola]|uniref:DUF4199 domain-containing protein n=1 Tax=Mucilaginibacter conchicola TaxID=2303333 RepID=A0A372NWU0_9SPHI|nr:DUF4199 domain-containing protein [Mucilaginibacter conchicola]RFZ94492.1 DUF4199 domain-containing protein [Mucilaginibacter conchicola]
MKKYVLRYGAIAATIVTLWMLGSISYCYAIGTFEGNMWLGYASMLLAFSFIFVAIKTYRDKQNAGAITFGQAFKIGLYISLVASTVYVIAWLIDYYFFIPDFMERYTARSIERIQHSGKSAAEIADGIKMMHSMEKMYGSIFGVILLTYMEILPLALVVSLISALILKRKNRNGAVAALS